MTLPRSHTQLSVERLWLSDACARQFVLLAPALSSPHLIWIDMGEKHGFLHHPITYPIARIASKCTQHAGVSSQCLNRELLMRNSCSMEEQSMLAGLRFTECDSTTIKALGCICLAAVQHSNLAAAMWGAAQGSCLALQC